MKCLGPNNHQHVVFVIPFVFPFTLAYRFGSVCCFEPTSVFYLFSKESKASIASKASSAGKASKAKQALSLPLSLSPRLTQVGVGASTWSRETETRRSNTLPCQSTGGRFLFLSLSLSLSLSLFLSLSLSLSDYIYIRYYIYIYIYIYILYVYMFIYINVCMYL